MTGAMRARQTGQATVEHIGLVVILALLLGTGGLWIRHHLRSGGAAPAVFDHITAPLDRGSSPPDIGVAPASGRSGRLGRAFRRVVGLGRSGTGLAVAGAGAFVGGFGGGLRDTFQEFLRNPIETLAGSGTAAGAVVLDPIGVGAGGVRAAIDYAAELRAMAPAAAYRRFMHDLGGVGADVTIARGRRLARRALIEAMRRRAGSLGRRPPPGEP